MQAKSTAKPHVEAHLALSARSLRILGLSPVPKRGVFSFMRGTNTLAEMNYEVSSAKIRLCYQGDNAKGQTEVFQHSISLITSQCHFGGERYWLQCPSCTNNKYHLYLVRHRFLCRQCAGLTYRLSAQSKGDRLYTVKHSLGREIFSDYHMVRALSAGKECTGKPFTAS